LAPSVDLLCEKQVFFVGCGTLNRGVTMIVGIGTDIVSIDRIEKAALRLGDRFLKRLFTPGECSYCDSKRQRWQCYSARFAAKEAVLKAMGTGLSGCRWTEVEVAGDPSGRPKVRLFGEAARIAREKGIGEILISISHEKDKALAFAVAVAGENKE